MLTHLSVKLQVTGPTDPAPHCQVKSRKDGLIKKGKGRLHSVNQTENAFFGYFLTAPSFQKYAVKKHGREWAENSRSSQHPVSFPAGDTVGPRFSGFLAFQWSSELSHGPVACQRQGQTSPVQPERPFSSLWGGCWSQGMAEPPDWRGLGFRITGLKGRSLNTQFYSLWARETLIVY